MMASSIVTSTESTSQSMTFRKFLILCLLLLIVPVGQLSVHTISGSGLWHLLGIGEANIANHEQAIGILFNPWDHLQYASLAMENKLGFHFMSNLFTTEPHRSALFNLYFLFVGALSNLFDVQPLAVMVIISFFAAPVVGFIVFMICRQLKFAYVTSLLAVAIVIFGSDPGLILHLVNKAVA